MVKFKKHFYFGTTVGPFFCTHPVVETSAQNNLDSTEKLVKRSTELEYEDLSSNKPKNLNQVPKNLNQVSNLKIPSNF